MNVLASVVFLVGLVAVCAVWTWLISRALTWWFWVCVEKFHGPDARREWENRDA